MKKIAVINDLSGFGRCSLTAALPVISAMGHEACPLPTAVLSNQTGYDSFFCDDFTDNMESFKKEWKKLTTSFDGIFTGFIANERQIGFILDFIDGFSASNTLTLVDPVAGDGGSLYASYDKAMCEKICSLVKKADIITPNLTELCILSGGDYTALRKMDTQELLKAIHELSSSLTGKKLKTVITTGVPITRGEKEYLASCVLWDGGFNTVTAPKIGGSFSGTGDLFASVIISAALSGVDPLSAVIKAMDFISKSIESTVAHPYDRNDGIDFQKFLKIL
ncbi:MAG: pyridoxamine kinase [Oscillospiraceae bacterium]|nr:pyridoxamine kinase [Oscillospiraceae bacterium]